MTSNSTFCAACKIVRRSEEALVPQRMGLSLLVSVILTIGICCRAQNIFAQSAPPAPILSGTVKSSEGKPLEGVGVSARNAGQTFTTTVYTDQSGRFSFLPLSSGQYKIWARAVGFEIATAEAGLAGGGKKQIDLTLPTLSDFHKQLSGTEWVSSLPEDTPNDRRMKTVFINNCTGCHQVSFLLQNRFDAAGWGAVINLMQTMLSIGYAPEGKTPDAVIHAYKDELAEYLERVRGPGDSPLNFKLLPRPTGEAPQLVVTEYDLPRADMPSGWTMKHNGTDWSDGTPSRYDGRAAHDVAVDKGGYVWFADDATPERTLGKLDPPMGRVVDYKLPDSANAAESSHALVFDRPGNNGFAHGAQGSPTKFVPETVQIICFPRLHGFPLSVDFMSLNSNGNE